MKNYSKFVENLNNMKPSLVLLIGIPGCGKSTWIKNNKSKWENTVVVSPDEIRKQLLGDVSDQTKNSEIWKFAKLFAIESLKSGSNVIIDATNTDNVNRILWVESIQEEVDFKRIALVFYVSPEVAKDRIRKDIENNVDRCNVPDKGVDTQYEWYLDSLKMLPKEGFKIVTSWNEN